MSDVATTATRIVAYMMQKGYRPLKQRQLAVVLEMADDEAYEVFKLALRQLTSDGRVAKGRGNKFDLASRSRSLVGKLVVRGTNYGFVKLARGGIVEINRGHFGGALHGDTVEVEVLADFAPGKAPLGRVSAILSVGERRAVGTVIETYLGFYFIPIRGGVYPESPIMAPLGAIVHGDLVTVEYLKTGRESFTVKFLEKLGQSSDYSSTIEAVLRAYEISQPFPSEAVEESERVAALPLVLEGRTDFRNHTSVTIDPPDAKDFDDALSIEITPEGFDLYVHIADVSAAVLRNSELDVEARRRGTSVYLPGFVVPMLPYLISNSRCCLAPNEDRLAKTVLLQYDSQGKRLGYKLFRSVIRSSARLDYRQVMAFLSGETASLGGQEIDKAVRSLSNLAGLLLSRRIECGSLILDMPETRVVVDESGNAVNIVFESSDASHSLVEECMLAANCAVAELLLSRDIEGIFRIHDEPEPGQLETLKQILLSFGLNISKNSLRKADLADIIELVASQPIARVVNLCILRSMKIAQYRGTVSQHYALGFDKYLHFTSPIRRYPDLFVHQQLDAHYFRCAPVVEEPQTSDEIALSCSDTERNAQDCERNIVNLKTLEYLARFVGDEFDGVVTAVKEFGVVVELVQFRVDALIHISELGSEYYNLNGNGTAMIGDGGTVLAPGTLIRVKIAAVDLPRRRLELRIVRKLSATGDMRKRSKKPAKKAQKSSRKGGSPKGKRAAKKRKRR